MLSGLLSCWSDAAQDGSGLHIRPLQGTPTSLSDHSRHAHLHVRPRPDTPTSMSDHSLTRPPPGPATPQHAHLQVFQPSHLPHGQNSTLPRGNQHSYIVYHFSPKNLLFLRLLSTAHPTCRSTRGRIVCAHLHLLSFYSLNPLPSLSSPLLSRPLVTLLLLNLSQFSVLKLIALSSEALSSLGLGTTMSNLTCRHSFPISWGSSLSSQSLHFGVSQSSVLGNLNYTLSVSNLIQFYDFT